jgi:lysyl-tRNA synthetase class 2
MSLSEQEIIRRDSMHALRMMGIEPYPADAFEVTHTSTAILEQFPENPEAFSMVRIAGRLMRIV